MENSGIDIARLDIQQVGIIVRDREKAIQKFHSLLGIGPFRLLNLDQPEVLVHGKKIRCSVKLAFAQAGPIEIELIEPGEGNSIWSEFLHTKGEGLQHLGTFVPDLDRELSRFSKMGIGLLQLVRMSMSGLPIWIPKISLEQLLSYSKEKAVNLSKKGEIS